jgi:hypothetical protein
MARGNNVEEDILLHGCSSQQFGQASVCYCKRIECMEAVISDDRSYFLSIAETVWFLWFTPYELKAQFQQVFLIYHSNLVVF